MSLSPESIALLRDEAYLALCRQALGDALASAKEATEQVRGTRPPFGFLASRKTRDDFEKSLQDAANNETALRNRLDKVEMLDTWIKSELRPLLHGYLCHASEEYRRGSDVRAALTQIGNQLPLYVESLQAYARELRTLAQALAVHEPRETLQRAYGDLKQSTSALDCQTLQYEINTQRLVKTVERTIFAEIPIPPPPLPTQTVAIDQMARIEDPVQLMLAAAEREKEARAAIASGIPALQGQLEAIHAQIAQLERAYLDKYWKQLREHAETHYVTQRDLDDVLHELSERYVIQHRQQNALQSPYMYER